MTHLLLGALRRSLRVHCSSNSNRIHQGQQDTVSMTFNNRAAELLTLPRDDVQKWLDSFDTVISDCDGVLWVHNDALPGSADVINRLKQLGKRVFFITNNSTKTRTEFAAKAAQLRFNVAEPDIVSTAYVAAKYLQQRRFDGVVYVIGSTGITRELDAVGIRHIGTGPDVQSGTFLELANGDWRPDARVGAVIVGFDEHISYPKLFKAATYLDRPECLFIATNTDARFPVPNGVIPGTGSIVRAVEVAAGRAPVVMGKPNALVAEALRVDHEIVPERTLMIGDRCNTDILFGVNSGFQTLLVGTGIHGLADVQQWLATGTEEERRQVPDCFVPKLGDLLGYLGE